MSNSLEKRIEYLEKQLQQTIQEKELILSALEVLDVGIHVIDSTGHTIVYTSQEIEQTKKENVLGKHITEAYSMTEEESIQLKVLKQGVPIKNYHTTYISPDGKTTDIITNTLPIFSKGKVIAAVSENRDITDVKKLADKVVKLQKDLYTSQRKQNKNSTHFSFNDIVVSSNSMKSTVVTAKKIAVNLSPVLIQGETGTGKELFAQSIHNFSPRSNGPFVAINCSAIPETLLESILFGSSKGAFTGAEEKPGLFEEAQDGTLFLDEVNSMSLLLQAKFLRVLQTNKVRRVGGNKEIPINARIISAINEEPLEAIAKNRLRNDFYYRIAVANLFVPPLRKQSEEIPPLIKHFISKFNKIMGKSVQYISPEVVTIFNKYSWPGNVRELEHTIEHAMNIVEKNDTLIYPHHLPSHMTNKLDNQDFYKISGNPNLKETMFDIEKDIICKELSKNNGNITRTAKHLSVSRQYLQYRIKHLRIDVKSICSQK